ncbi:MAG TPA: hypothetical protein VM008_02300 [Phycisphaerae bacterium]|nr:hypothetical protein [Phycisphaerae bacterium]
MFGGLLGLVIFILDIVAIVDVIRSRKPTAYVALWIITDPGAPAPGNVALLPDREEKRRGVSGSVSPARRAYNAGVVFM